MRCAIPMLPATLALAALLAAPALAQGRGNPGGLKPPDIDLVGEQVDLLAERLDLLETLVPLIETKRVFVTSESFTGDLGGLDGADARCQTAAQTAGLDGRFLPWLSILPDETGSPESGPLHRFTRHAVPYVRTDGVTVADHFGDLVDGTLDAPIDVTEFGVQLFAGNTSWSSTLANGAPAGGTARTGSCGNWTQGAGGGLVATALFLGQVGATNHLWSAPFASVGIFCSTPQRLVCVEQ